jgi:FkbM family methyltransferase
MAGLLDRVGTHVEGAAELYGLSHGLREKADVTRFLLDLKRAQLWRRFVPRQSNDRDVSVTLHGAHMVVNLFNSEILLYGEIYDQGVYDRLADFIPVRGSAVVDVGANVGMFSVLQARRGARVYAFEPNGDCYRRLSKAVVRNGLTGEVSVFNYAVGRATGMGAMRVPADLTVMGSVVPLEAAEPGDRAGVRITCLDRMLPALGVDHVDLLKVDTEGAEVDVLVGADAVLGATDRVILEYHSGELHREASRLLTEHGLQEVGSFDSNDPEAVGVGMLYAARPGAGAGS